MRKPHGSDAVRLFCGKTRENVENLPNKVTYKSEGLQKLRKAAGLSQSQLADLAGIKVQVLQQYERGARDINGAKLPTLLKICNALECRLADIITDEETLELLKKYEEH